MIYFAYIHSIITYGIIFWDISSYTIKRFRIQKNVIRIMRDLKKRDSCRDSFKEMKILSLCSQYIYSLMKYTVNNIHLFTRNTEVHNIDTRQNINLVPHPPQVLHLLKFKRSLQFMYNDLKLLT
jgi:hypothetical protein